VYFVVVWLCERGRTMCVYIWSVWSMCCLELIIVCGLGYEFWVYRCFCSVQLCVDCSDGVLVVAFVCSFRVFLRMGDISDIGQVHGCHVCGGVLCVLSIGECELGLSRCLG